MRDVFGGTLGGVFVLLFGATLVGAWPCAVGGCVPVGPCPRDADDGGCCAMKSGGAPPASPGPSPIEARERRAMSAVSSDAAFASSSARSSFSTSEAASAALRTHLIPSR